MKTLILIILIAISSVSFAQTSVIKGNAKEYAGKQLNVYKVSNIFTGEEQSIGSGIVSETGDFYIEIPATEVFQITIPVGIYKGGLFIEPGKIYNIALPVLKNKSEAEELNPYFKHTEIYLNTDSIHNDVNTGIKAFDFMYYSYIDERFNLFFLKNYKKQLEADILKMDSMHLSHPSVYFKNYRKCKYLAIRHSSYMRDNNTVIDKYFVGYPVQLNNTAYVELFHQLFDNYLLGFESIEDNQHISRIFLEKRAISELDSIIQHKRFIESDTLRDMIVLKCLYDSFYKGHYSKENTLFLLNSYIRNAQISTLKNQAVGIRNKFTKLMTGQPAPLFTLTGKDQKDVSLSNFEGRFVYLNFCNAKSYSCLEQFKLLKDLHQKKGEFVEIVSICVDSDFNEILNLAKEEGYNWTFLHYKKQIDVISKYDIYKYPTYYLINPEGELLLSPAPSPKENFDQQFAEIWIAREREKIRNNDGNINSKPNKGEKGIKER